ncbi:hypothetical protein KI387_018745, partial [Taxus chinensis]
KRYGAKDTIRYEPIEKFHIEPYVPSPINANFSSFDQEYFPSTLEMNTKVGGIPDLTLDEWENKRHSFDPYKEMEEAELGIYCLHKENPLLPNITKSDEKDDNE